MPSARSYPSMVLQPGPCPTCRAPMTAGVLWAGGSSSSYPGLRDVNHHPRPVHVAWGVWCDRCGPALATQVVTVNADPTATPYTPWLRIGLTPSGRVTIEGAAAVTVDSSVARALAETVELLATDLPEARAEHAAPTWSLYRDEGSSSVYADGPKGHGPSRCLVRLGDVGPGASCYSCGAKLEALHVPVRGLTTRTPATVKAFVLDHGGDPTWVVAVGDELPYVCTPCIATARVREQARKPALRLISSQEGG